MLELQQPARLYINGISEDEDTIITFEEINIDESNLIFHSHQLQSIVPFEPEVRARGHSLVQKVRLPNSEYYDLYPMKLKLGIYYHGTFPSKVIEIHCSYPDVHDLNDVLQKWLQLHQNMSMY